MKTIYALLTTVLAWLYVFELAKTDRVAAQVLVLLLGSFIVGSIMKALNDLKKEGQD